MKTKHAFSSLGTTLILTLLSGVGFADVLDVSPSVSAVPDADASGVTRVLVKFDLSGMRQGAGREIHAAHINWDLGPLSRERVSFQLYEPTEEWNTDLMSSGASIRTLPESRKTWDLESMDLSRIGGLVRFNVQELVAKWLVAPSQNFGVLIVTEDLDASVLSRALAEMHLVVRYGFQGLE